MENIVVIGGGLMGSATAWQLSHYGEKVLLLEQQSANYREGSSFGESRITRSLGPKKDIFSFLQRKTIEESQKLLNFLNGINRPKTHKMGDIYSTSPVTYIYHKSQKNDLQKLRFKGQKDKNKKASGDAAFRKFGMTLPESYVVVKEYKKYSGTLNPKVFIKKLHLGIKKHKNEIHYNQKALSIVKKGNHYEVKTMNMKTGQVKKIQAKKIVVASGPYTVPLLKKLAPYFKKLIMPKKVVLSFFKIDKRRYQSYTSKQKKLIFNSHPVFDQNEEMYFSMIDKTDKNGVPIFKVGGHQLRGNVPDLDTVWKEKPKNKEIKWSKKSFRKYLEMLEIPIKKKEIKYIKSYQCVYSVSRTKIPYVTNIITKERNIDPNVVVIGGMSGTGAKGCLTYGLLAADLILNIQNSDKMYQKTKKALGTERLRNEVVKRFI